MFGPIAGACGVLDNTPAHKKVIRLLTVLNQLQNKEEKDMKGIVIVGGGIPSEALKERIIEALSKDHNVDVASILKNIEREEESKRDNPLDDITFESCNSFVNDLRKYADEVGIVVKEAKSIEDIYGIAHDIINAIAVKHEVPKILSPVNGHKLINVLKGLSALLDILVKRQIHEIAQIVTWKENNSKADASKKVVNTFKTPNYEDMDKDELINLLKSKDKTLG